MKTHRLRMLPYTGDMKKSIFLIVLLLLLHMVFLTYMFWHETVITGKKKETNWAVSLF